MEEVTLLLPVVVVIVLLRPGMLVRVFVEYSCSSVQVLMCVCVCVCVCETVHLTLNF